MGTTVQKLSKVLNTKNEIKDILLSKGAIEETTPFGEYPSVLRDICGGGNSDKIVNISLKRSAKISIGILRDDSPQVINDNIVSVVAARQ